MGDLLYPVRDGHGEQRTPDDLFAWAMNASSEFQRRSMQAIRGYATDRTTAPVGRQAYHLAELLAQTG